LDGKTAAFEFCRMLVERDRARAVGLAMHSGRRVEL